ncbi:MAG: hypothetical protein H0Z33_06735 [Bacillaceae bacterium]|nr:hypothetical protein [Bacillaceae bacterium]
MSWTGKTLIGLVMLIIGAAVFLNAVGIHAGNLIGLLIAIALIFYGFKLFKHSESSLKRGLGVVLLVFGALSLAGAAHLFFGILLAAVIIYFGWNMLKQEKADSTAYSTLTPAEKLDMTISRMEDSFEREWNRLMKDKQK